MSTHNCAVGPALAGPLAEATIELVARRFAVLGEPQRLRLIHALFQGEQNVGALVRATGGTQTNVSRHLQTLVQAGLLARRRQGPQVFYTLADPAIGPLCDLVCGSLQQQLRQQSAAFAS